MGYSWHRIAKARLTTLSAQLDGIDGFNSVPVDTNCDPVCIYTLLHIFICSGITGWSTMYPDDEEVQGAMQIFLERSLSGLQGIDSSWLTSAGQLLQSIAPKWVTRPIER